MNTPIYKDPKFRVPLIVLGSVMLVLAILVIFLPVWRVPLGISLRFLLAGLCFVDGLWVLCRQGPKLVIGLLALVGLGLIVTALMGYSFNQTPPRPWLFR